MLMGKNSDDEKRVVISSTTNEWPQHMIPNDHHQKSLIINQSPNNNKNMASSSSTIMDQKAGQEHPHQTLKCPRCDSSNTKFCYYNNYSLSQPRHFCKACKRYWTRGGTLRNVPVGGGCRKNRRPSSSSSSSSASKRAPHDHHHLINTSSTTASFPILPPPLLPPPPTSSSSYYQNDLTLAFSRLHNDQQLCSMFGSASSGFLDALKTGFLDSTPSHQYNGINSNYYGHSYDNNNNNDDDDNNDRIALNDNHNHHQNMIKNELCNGNYDTAAGNDNHNNRVLWGLPWQLNGSSSDHHHNMNGNIGNMVDFDGSTTTSTNGSGREFWSGFGSSNWHGLLNTTPLM